MVLELEISDTGLCSVGVAVKLDRDVVAVTSAKLLGDEEDVEWSL